MYVFVTVTELESEGREQDLGQLSDRASLQHAKDLVLSRIDSHIPPDSREDPRHFWHNDRIQRNDALLSDLGAESDIVALELRPDRYRVNLPGDPNTLVAFNPERTPAAFIGKVMPERHTGPCCYTLRPRDGDVLEPDQDLLEQNVHPQGDLTMKRKPVYYVWTGVALGLAAVVGLLSGYLSGQL